MGDGMTDIENITTLSVADAVRFVSRALVQSGVSETNAAKVAAALVAAEIDGQKGHGLSRVKSYALQARSGKVNGTAVPQLEICSAGLIRVDAQNGFAFPAIALAISELLTRLPETGIAAAGIIRSHHAGQMGAHVEALAEQGMIALMFANTPKAMAPWGGSQPVFGTNPIAFASPRADAAPLVIDLSLSKVARGKVMAADKAGDSIPKGWALDQNGQATTDPKAALAGSMVPLGDAKGAALSLMVEILSASLIGANHSFEATSFFEAEGAPPGVGQMIIAIDPQKFGGQAFETRLSALCSAILAQSGTRLPGASRGQKRQDARKNGINIPPYLRKEIEDLIAHV